MDTQELPRFIVEPSTPSRRVRAHVSGWLLTLGWLALLVAGVVVGEQPTTYEQLESQLLAGEVSEVEVNSTAPPAAWSGAASVELRWRDGLFLRTTELTEASSPYWVRRAGRDLIAARPVVLGPVGDHLRALAPGLRVVEGERPTTWRRNRTAWWFPDQLKWAAFALLITTLLHIPGREPWRATRWAWAWLVMSLPPIGVPAYLLLSGATGVLRPSNPRSLWLTGGWAFLLVSIVGTVVRNLGMGVPHL